MKTISFLALNAYKLCYTGTNDEIRYVHVSAPLTTVLYSTLRLSWKAVSQTLEIQT